MYENKTITGQEYAMESLHAVGGLAAIIAGTWICNHLDHYIDITFDSILNYDH